VSVKTSPHLLDNRRYLDSLRDFFLRRWEQAVKYPSVNDSLARWDTFYQEMVQADLRFYENMLQSVAQSCYFEISVFTDRDHPRIDSFYNSNGDVRPRSYAERESDPLYYRKKRYEVVELFDDPSRHPIVIPDARAGAADYTLMGKLQKQRIQSTILSLFCSETPAALVVTADQPEFFSYEKTCLIELTKAMGLAIRADFALRDAVVIRDIQA
jgi:hypothetical protein